VSRKPPRSSPGHAGAASRHRKPPSSARKPSARKPSLVAAALRGRVARVTAAAVAAAAILVTAWPAASHLLVRASDLAWVAQADALGMQLASSLAVKAAERPELVSEGIAVVPGYRNPLRDVSGLNPERIDMGVDFGGSGPVYALGNAVITNASGNAAGWPGGGWITYKLTDGPDAGLMVYLAEDVTPTVQVGQHVSSATVIGTMFAGGDGIETGWAQQSGLSAESQLAQAGGVGGNGPFPTRIGLSFEELLQSLGAPTAPNRTQAPFGLLPPGYPAIGV
jgi:hypothetical protein